MARAENRHREPSASKPLNLREFKTNIQPLDRLLGYNEDLGSGTGIKPGDVILLRGGPGSGKTTLGLQIMSRYLESDDCRYVGNRVAAVFLSLETDPHKIIDKVTTDFHFFQKRRSHLLPFPASYMTSILLKLRLKHGHMAAGPVVNGLAKSGAGLVVGASKDVVVPVAKLLAEWGRSFFLASKQALGRRKAKDQTVRGSPSSNGSGCAADLEPEGILFIDSINALLAIVHQYTQLDQWKARLALNSAFAMVREKFNRFVILVSSEFHREPSWVPTGMSESFLSDVEILLANEPIAVPLGYEAGQQGSVGYNIFKIIEKIKGEEGTKLESRSFIRVLKSRKGPNQSRRCAYDIVSGVGVQFYETYPGDGHILLFSENPKQKKVWDTFFREDLPQLYPALRYEDFDRSSLQRTFLNQRRSRYVPSRTDMYVSSFDNYWINWYGELCWRRAVTEGVADSIQITDENTVQVAMLTSAIHRSLMKQPEQLQKCLSTILQRDKEDKILNEALIAFAALSRRNNCIKCFLCRSCWWILKKIAKEKKTVFDSALIHMATEKKQPNRDKNELIRNGVLPSLTAPPGETDEIKNILCRMQKYTAESECCENSPIRLFYERLDRTTQNITSVFEGLKATAYEKPSDLENILNIKADQIKRILAVEENRASELSKALDETKHWIKSNDVRQKLGKELLNYAASSEGDSLKSEIDKVLHEAAGCECQVEFWKHLGSILSKKINAVKHIPAEKEELEQIRELFLSKSSEIINELFDALPPMLLEDPEDEPERSEPIVNLWTKLTKQPPYVALYNLMITYHEILLKRNTYHFLSEIPDEKIRLFGERRSRIIKELETPSREDKRPIHRTGLLFSLRGTSSFVAIPYNANIGFVVCRHDLLQEFIEGHLRKDDQKNKLDEYVNKVLTLYKNQPWDTGAESGQASHLTDAQEEKVKKFVSDNIMQYIAPPKGDKRSPKVPLQTWEELIALLQLMNEDNNNKLRRHFVIETQTLDTLLCTILEFLWNCGGNLKIRPDYSIEKETATREKLFQALYLLGTMLHEGIIPDDSTLDVTHFAKRYNKPQDPQSSNEPEDWVFARHWYSTLVDLLTTKKKPAYRDGSAVTEISDSGFLWKNSKAELGIMPIPISLSYYLEKGEKAHHISCWGDWHWIMTRGTENTELGIDLINNLISSQKVCERAFQCAAVPTVEEFYTLYGNSSCLNLPERCYDTPTMLPDITFEELKDTYFPHACSRSQIFDYEHCMLELQSLFQFVRSLAKDKDPKWHKLRREIEEAFGRIKALRTQLILTV